MDDGLLQHSDDKAAIVRAMRFIDELIGHESLKSHFGPILQPPLGEDWEEFASTMYDCYHNGAGDYRGHGRSLGHYPKHP